MYSKFQPLVGFMGLIMCFSIISIIPPYHEARADSDCVHVPYGKRYQRSNNPEFITICDVKAGPWKRTKKDFNANSRQSKGDNKAYYTYTSRLTNICTNEGDVFEAIMGSYVFEPKILVVDYNNKIAKVGYSFKEIEKTTGRTIYWSRLAFKCPLFAGGIPHLVLTQTQATQGPYVFSRRMWKKRNEPNNTLPVCQCRLPGVRPFNPGPNCRGVLGQSDPCQNCNNPIYNCR